MASAPSTSMAIRQSGSCVRPLWSLARIRCQRGRWPMRKIRLGLYDPLEHDRRVRYVGRSYIDTPRNRRMLRLAIVDFNRLSECEDDISMALGVFPTRDRKGARHA